MWAWVRDPTRPPSAALRLRSLLAPYAQSPGPAGHVLVKSVKCALSLEWIHSRFGPKVLVITRNPFDVVASRMELGWLGSLSEGKTFPIQHDPRIRDRYLTRWGVGPPGDAISRLTGIAYHAALMTCALQEAASRHPEWITVTHERLCRDPVGEFCSLAHQLDLKWTKAAEDFIRDSNRAGRGHQTARVSASEPNRYGERLTTSEIAAIATVFDAFPLRAEEFWDWP